MKSILGYGFSLVLALLASHAVHAESGLTATTVSIGQSAAFNGLGAEQGNNFSNGIQLYLDTINAKGGVHGREIVLKALDDGGDPARTQQNSQKLMNEDKVFALMGYVGAGPSHSALALVEKTGLPFLFPHTGADALRGSNRWVFHVRAGYKEEATKVIDHLVTIGAKQVAIVYQNDEAGKAGLHSYEEALQNAKLKVVGQTSLDAAGQYPQGALTAIVALKPDAILLATTGKTSVTLIKDYLSIPKTEQPPFFGYSDIGVTQLRKGLGDQAIGIGIAQVMPSPWNGKYAVVREYRDALSMAYGIGRASYRETQFKAGQVEPSHAGLEGWIAAKVMVEALKRAGKDLTRAKFVTALESLHNFDTGDFVLDFSRDKHIGSSFAELSILRAGGKITQ